AIRLESYVDGSLGVRILLTHFAQPQECPRRTLQHSVLLQREGICPETATGPSRLSGPLPRTILLRRAFRSQHDWRRFFRWCPLDLAHLISEASHARALAAGSTPTGRQFARVAFPHSV